MNGEQDPVVEAARRFLDAVIAILKENCASADDVPLELPEGFSTWAPDLELGGDMRRFKALPMVLTAEQQCAARMLGELRNAALQPLLELESTLAADPLIGPRLDQEVSSSGAGGQTWQAAPMVQLLVDRAISEAGGFQLEPSLRDVVTSQWTQQLRRTGDRMAVVVALHAFHAPAVPIWLGPSLAIDELADKEIGAALRLGAGRIGLATRERLVSRVFGIRSSFESRLWVGGVPPTESEREMAVRTAARQLAERVLLALRVFKAGRVSTSGTFEYTTSWDADVSPASGSFWSWFGWQAGEPYSLAEEETESFLAFWAAFQDACTAEPIASALRRFDYAADRTLLDDTIVDLLIAAETLFFSDISKADRGEFRFRLSVRVALLLGETPAERKDIAKFMRHAYDARSGIVHGGDPGDENLRSLKGERVTAAEHADLLKDVLRRSLRSAIEMAASGQSFPPDWEKMMFAGPGLLER